MKELLPINKRTMEHFTAAFEGPELQPIVEFQVCKYKGIVCVNSILMVIAFSFTIS